MPGHGLDDRRGCTGGPVGGAPGARCGKDGGSSSYNFTPINADGVDPGYGTGQGEATEDLERMLGTAPGVSADW
jgi:hypothetical protein